LKVSALIPTYNRKEYVIRAIESVLAQTAPVDEIVIVDDGSTDGTAEAIHNRYGSRVRVVRQQNMGVSVARTRAISEARGEWIAFLDSDDAWVPERNAALLKAASLMPETVAWIFGDSAYVSDMEQKGTIFAEQGLAIDRELRIFENPLSELLWDWARPRPCVLESSFIRKSALQELKCFSEGLRHTEDFLASVQVASRFSFAAIPLVVTKIYRTSDLTGTSIEKTLFFTDDHYRGVILSYEIAARATGAAAFRVFHAEAVRSFCEARAREGRPFRRLALEQFTFGISMRSVIALGIAMLGPGIYRAGLAAKRKMRIMGQPGSSSRVNLRGARIDGSVL
jgi:glycosyltransferase involved in cell wall biosynthesis